MQDCGSKLRKKNIIISIDVEKACGNIHHIFIIRILKKLVREGNFLNQINCIFEKNLPFTSY
jgi:hypothetical protein